MDTTITPHNQRDERSGDARTGMSTERFISSAAAARPHRLLDHVLVCERIKNDAELSRVLRLVPSVISKIRHGHAPVSAEVILRMHDAFQIPIAELKRLEADHWTVAARI